MMRQWIADTLRAVAWKIAPTEAYRRVRAIRGDALPSPEMFAAIAEARRRRGSTIRGERDVAERRTWPLDDVVGRPDDLPTVCLTHQRFVPCRSGCHLSSDPGDVAAVRAYQERGEQ